MIKGFLYGRSDEVPAPYVRALVYLPSHRNISLPSVLGRDILLRLGLVLDIHRQEVRLAE